MSIQKLDDCELEWDRARGVLYVHDKTTGSSVLRICGLNRNNAETGLLRFGKMIDITNPERVTYPDPVVDVCLAGNPALNGCCGEEDCVCA